MKLYRAVSQREKDNYQQFDAFKTGVNTLEAKQFFKTLLATTSFVSLSITQNYQPPYEYILIIDIDEICLRNSHPTDMNLASYEAVSVGEDDLPQFNNCVRFVEEKML